MNRRKLSLMLVLAGAAILVFALAWFLVAYAESMEFVGRHGGTEMIARLLPCLYSSPAICEGASFLDEGPAYSPALFWVGLVALAVGLVLRFTQAKEIAASTPAGSPSVGDGILGFIPEGQFTRTSYILVLAGAVGGVLIAPLMVVGLAGCALALLGLLGLRPRLDDLDRNHLAAICIVFAASFVLLVLTTGSSLFVLFGLVQIALFYIGFKRYRQGRPVTKEAFQGR